MKISMFMDKYYGTNILTIVRVHNSSRFKIIAWGWHQRGDRGWSL